ncbi:MAG: hypothetical protein M3299_02520 [Thermoproteota archaeon]|nr:hypothetical protein [Thermoproteota archaeon]
MERELDGRSREFYEFVMPAIDIIEEGNDLVVTIDLPCFAKKDINLRIIRNVLYITAERAGRGPWHGVLQAQAAQDRQKGSIANIV